MSGGFPVFVARIGASRGQLRSDEEAFRMAMVYSVAKLTDEFRSTLLAGEVEAFGVDSITNILCLRQGDGLLRAVPLEFHADEAFCVALDGELLHFSSQFPFEV